MSAPATSVVLPPEQQRQLTELALASPAVEVCALLGGCGQHLQTVYPVRNVAARPAAEFLFDAEGQIAAMKAMRATGEELRGIFHSHPASPAEPSATDRARAAYPDVYYLILSLASNSPVLRGFYFDGSQFHAVDIEAG